MLKPSKKTYPSEVLYQTEKLKLHSYNFSPTWGEIKKWI